MCLDWWFKPALSPKYFTPAVEYSSQEPEEDDAEDTVSISKARKKFGYERFFRQQTPPQLEQLAFTQRLSTIANDKFINIINLPLKLVHNNNQHSQGRTPMEIRTPREFSNMMGIRTVGKLGVGGYGEVFLVTKYIAHGTNNNKIRTIQMACKTILLKENNEPRTNRRFESIRAELYVLQSLAGQCPYVIEYIEHYILRYRPLAAKSNETLLLTSIYMEYADGGTLFQQVKKGALKRSLVKRYFTEMAIGLEFMHRQQIAHNDFKLENVLLVKDKTRAGVCHCKLTDFGMSQFAWKDGVGLIYSKQHCGTRIYMAPEVLLCALTEARPVKYVPFKADIWALGISLYIMLCRQYPYEVPQNSADHKYKKLLKRLKNGVITKWQAKRQFGSIQLAKLLTGMLTYQPDKRLNIEMVTKHRWLQK